MFKKIVTELIYSPALAGTLGNYIKKVRDERSKRQIGLIFLSLAVFVQIFAILYPPESSNSSNPSAMIDGGIQSIEDYLKYYDQNADGAKDLLSSLDISRTDLENTRPSPLPTSSQLLYWSTKDDRRPDASRHTFQTTQGKIGTAYYHTLPTEAEVVDSYSGTSSSSGKKFAISKLSGNLITEDVVKPSCELIAESKGTAPVSINSWTDFDNCPDILDLSLSARALSSTSPKIQRAHTSDRIVYTIKIDNKSDFDIPLTSSVGLEDTLEYSRILDTGGGEYNYDTKTLDWPTQTVSAGSDFERSFIIQILPNIPSTAQGKYTEASYDCLIATSFGNTISIPIDCPAMKHIEGMVRSLPEASVRLNLTVSSIILLVAIYLYFRSRQILTELYIIRHTHLGGF